ncbi:MAG: outer membrane protein assembly factor BamD [Acidobacteria bacterium]|nr:outer membrane protein assembly factor BamD [Acidobacteriota bacterium]
MKSWKIPLLLVFLSIITSACGQAKKSVAGEDPHPGRDRELFEEGLTELQKRKFVQGRLLLNTLINSYPDSPFLAMSKLATADSFFAEGTTEALAQAEVEYKDFANFFPTHPLADDALLQVAYVKMHGIQAPNRDQTNTRLAERALLALLQRYPNTNLKDEVARRLKDVREVMAEHEMEVARLYGKREQYKGARGRLKTVAEKYPDYSARDETLFKLGVLLFEEEQDPEQASKYLAQLVREFPESSYRKRAAELIEIMGKPVPEAEVESVAPRPPREERGFFGSLWGGVRDLVGSPDLDVPEEGVLLKRDETPEALIATAKEYSINSAVVTPTSSSISVGPSGAIPAGGASGASGRQELRIGPPPASGGKAGSGSPATAPEKEASSSPENTKSKIDDGKDKKVKGEAEESGKASKNPG